MRARKSSQRPCAISMSSRGTLPERFSIMWRRTNKLREACTRCGKGHARSGNAVPATGPSTWELYGKVEAGR
jgi:hypothetical protein